jgi:zinc protease
MRYAVGRALIMTLCAGLLAAAGPAGPEKGPWKEPPGRFPLKTGISLIYHQDKASPTTVVGLFASGGRSAVPEGLDGLAYLTTRLTLEIPDEGKVQDLMAQATRMSLVCSEDCSIILIECLSENLKDALRVAAKIIQDPLMTGLRVGRAKEMMKLYARAEEDDAVVAGHNAALKSFFQGKGYGSATYGSDASRKTIKRGDIVAFFRRFFTSKGVFFCVVSDLEEAPIQALLEDHFSAFREGLPEDVPASLPTLPADRQVVLMKEARQTYIARVYALPVPSPGDQAMGYLLETLLGKGPGSRLWSLRATDRLAYNVDARLTWTKSAGILEAYMETENAKAARADVALESALAELWEKGVTEGNLETTKTMAKASFLRLAETKPDRVRILGLFEVLGLGYGHFSGIFGAIDAVTLGAMNTFIRAALEPGKALKVTIGPAADGR